MKIFSIPLSFFYTHYDGSKYPGSPKYSGLKYGANCQSFAYELLRHFKLKIPDFRSSNLWDDKIYTRQVSKLKPLDLMLFNKNKDAYGAHVGVYLGHNLVIHLSKEVGYPTIWNLGEFKKRKRYKIVIGVKRVKTSRRFY